MSLKVNMRFENMEGVQSSTVPERRRVCTTSALYKCITLSAASLAQGQFSSDVVNGVLVRKDYRYGSIAAIIE